MRKDIIALTLELTFENTFPGKAIEERVFKVEGKVNVKHGGATAGIFTDALRQRK